MIIGIIGLPGSGKTVTSTWFAQNAQKKGIEVCANYHIGGSYYASDCKDLLLWLVSRNPRDPGYSPRLGIIDEANHIFGARDWKDLDAGTRMFLSQHRKAGEGTNLIITTQSFGFVDKYIRSLCNVIYVVQKYRFGIFRLVGWIPSQMSDTNEFQGKQKQRPYDSKWFIATKKLYSLFDTYERVNTAEKKNDLILDKDAKTWLTQSDYLSRYLTMTPYSLPQKCGQSLKERVKTSLFGNTKKDSLSLLSPEKSLSTSTKII